VFANGSFTQRLGSPRGLKMLGMYHQGIIWNNDTTSWETKRKIFNQGGGVQHNATWAAPPGQAVAGSLALC
jgi:hypothetical protein